MPVFNRNNCCIALFVYVVLLVTACDNKQASNSPVPADTPGADKPLDPAATLATESAWHTGQSILQTCVSSSENLRTAVRLFLENPSADTQTQAQQAWQQAHHSVLAFSVYFAVGDNNPGLFGELIAYRDNLDAQPIQPGFIDYFSVYQFSGIVNDLAITLSAEALRQQHGITDHSDVSIGLHAIEYLLWGEDGKRPVSDYAPISSLNEEQTQQGLRVVDLPNNRRRVYLQLLAELLVDDCSRLADMWRDSTQSVVINYFALQPGSRLQLWQSVTLNLIDKLTVQLDDASVSESPTDTETDATENDTATPDSDTEIELALPHNQFAGQESRGIAAQLTSISTLLYGERLSGADNSNTELQPSNTIAVWLSLETSSSDTNEAPVLALQAPIEQGIAKLNAQTQWPLPAADRESLQQTLTELRNAIAGTAATTPVPDENPVNE